MENDLTTKLCAISPFEHLYNPISKDRLLVMESQVKAMEARLFFLKEEIANIRQDLLNDELMNCLPNDAIQNMKAQDVIIEFLRPLCSPISKKDLKRWILKEGYPRERFGKSGVYYYVALKRLQEKGKINIKDDVVSLRP